MADKFHLFRSVNDPSKSITIGEYENGFYYIPAAGDSAENIFASIEEIEIAIDDKLEMIVKREH